MAGRQVPKRTLPGRNPAPPMAGSAPIQPLQAPARAPQKRRKMMAPPAGPGAGPSPLGGLGGGAASPGPSPSMGGGIV
jgi:hypothetical protein